ncbi:MAG: hypothetical protein QOE65_2556 [Solirubrobacteraceae bacterium]|jgi:uncharacterized delta-60 repeat protein|nr:hypothetical protein [Solirubrobacteraceae bacterium]
MGTLMLALVIAPAAGAATRGAHGSVLLHLPGTRLATLAGHAGDRPVLVTRDLDAPATQLTLTRLRSDGRPDAAFGIGGTVSTRVPATFESTPIARELDDGAILVVGRSRSDLLLIRISPAGALDTAFGSGGQRRVGLPASAGWPVFVDGDGGVLVPRTLTGADGRRGMAVTRLRSDGAADDAFGTAGTAAAPEAQGGVSTDASAVVRDLAGRVLVAGVADAPNPGAPPRVAVARLGADGRPDQAWAHGALALQDHPSPRAERLLVAALGADSAGGAAVSGAYGEPSPGSHYFSTVPFTFQLDAAGAPASSPGALTFLAEGTLRRGLRLLDPLGLGAAGLDASGTGALAEGPGDDVFAAARGTGFVEVARYSAAGRFARGFGRDLARFAAAPAGRTALRATCTTEARRGCRMSGSCLARPATVPAGESRLVAVRLSRAQRSRVAAGHAVRLSCSTTALETGGPRSQVTAASIRVG